MRISPIEILFILSIIILYFLPRKSDKWKWLCIVSLFFLLLNVGIRLHLINVGHETNAHVKRRVNVLHSIELHVSIDAVTPDRPETGKLWSLGLGSVVALFSSDMTRYRFVSDLEFCTQQISPNVNRIMFVYKPEDPTQLLGRQITFLEEIHTFVCDYSKFSRRCGFDTGNESNVVNVLVLLNGVEVVELRIIATPGLLTSGQASFDISEAFDNISEKYALRLKAKEVY